MHKSNRLDTTNPSRTAGQNHANSVGAGAAFARAVAFDDPERDPLGARRAGDGPAGEPGPEETRAAFGTGAKSAHGIKFEGMVIKGHPARTAMDEVYHATTEINARIELTREALDETLNRMLGTPCGTIAEGEGSEMVPKTPHCGVVGDIEGVLMDMNDKLDAIDSQLNRLGTLV